MRVGGFSGRVGGFLSVFCVFRFYDFIVFLVFLFVFFTFLFFLCVCLFVRFFCSLKIKKWVNEVR